MAYHRMPGECPEEHAKRLIALLRERDAELESLRGGSCGNGDHKDNSGSPGHVPQTAKG